MAPQGTPLSSRLFSHSSRERSLNIVFIIGIKPSRFRTRSGAVSKSPVSCEFCHASRGTKAAPYVVIRDTEIDPPVGDFECFVRNNGGVFVASPPWRISRCKINARVKSQKGCNCFVHRDMHALAAPVDLGCIERGENTLGCRELGHEVSNGGTNLVRWSIAWSGQIHDPGLALHDYIVAGSILLRPTVAKTGDGGIDHHWASGPHSLVAETKPLHGAGPKVLNHHI